MLRSLNSRQTQLLDNATQSDLDFRHIVRGHRQDSVYHILKQAEANNRHEENAVRTDQERKSQIRKQRTTQNRLEAGINAF